MSDHDTLAGQAAREWGLPRPSIIRRGMTSVYSAGPDTVLRISAATPSTLALPTFLERMSRLSLRVPACGRDVLVFGDGQWAVLAMERVYSVGGVDWCATGRMVQRLHSLPTADEQDLPWCGDFTHWRIEELLAEAEPQLDPAAAAGMRSCVERAGAWHAQMLAAPQVVLHGDLHPGNVVQSADGPVLLDWDLRCVGPAAWDHGPLLRWGQRWTQAWGGGPGSYERFADGYGASLHRDPLTIALAELRLLVATLMRLRAARVDPAASAEAQLRLAYWRGDAGAPLWNPQ